jgi:transposase-like protein
MKPPPCVYCQSAQVVRNGSRTNKSTGKLAVFLCKACGKYFSERTGTPLERLRTPPEVIAQALEARNEGTGLRASARLAKVAHASVLLWERRIQRLGAGLQPAFPPGSDADPGGG